MGKITNNFIVASDYNWLPENIEDSWIPKYTDNYLIYDRYHRFPESDKIKHQKNVGQNIYDIFDFIITNYNNLPDATIFCRSCIFFPKGRTKPLSNGTCNEEFFARVCDNKIFTELHDFISPEVHNGGSSKFDTDGFGFLEINNSWYFSCVPGKYYSNLNHFFYDMYENPSCGSYIRFSPGGSYIIPKQNILKYSLKFYERIREILSWDIITGEAHMIERAIYTIFTCDWEVRKQWK